ncbi:hypothetical protein EPI10_024000 [Gossypium australe]|uniref:Uncharacterized protein n=1 Tax=Gossypium australe TaxID=47621 RepID=A0A5B6VXU2_9ROSI|nr:hypothetical protein EPI10_024000 [Gossypium australe]
MTYNEELIRILAREIKELRNKCLALVKIHLRFRPLRYLRDLVHTGEGKHIRTGKATKHKKTQKLLKKLMGDPLS